MMLWLKKMIRYGLIVFIAYVFFIAFMVGLTSIAIPYLNDHKTTLEKLTHHYVPSETQIKNVELRWRLFKPYIILNQVTIDHHKLVIDKAILTVSLLRSLFYLKPVITNLSLNHVKFKGAQEITGDNSKIIFQLLPHLTVLHITHLTYLDNVSKGSQFDLAELSIKKRGEAFEVIGFDAMLKGKATNLIYIPKFMGILEIDREQFLIKFNKFKISVANSLFETRGEYNVHTHSGIINLKCQYTKIKNVKILLKGLINEKVYVFILNGIDGGSLKNIDIQLASNNRNAILDYDIRFSTIGTTVSYLPNWPKVDNVNAKIEIRNNKFIAHANQVSLLNKTVNSVDLAITKFDNPIIQLNVMHHGPVELLQAFIKSSPIVNWLNPYVVNMNLVGLINLDTQLILPLNNISDYKLATNIDLLSTKLTLKTIVLTDLKGQIRLRNNQLEAKNIQGQWLKNPIILNLNYNKKLFIGLNTNFKIPSLPSIKSQWIDGNIPVSAKFVLDRDQGNIDAYLDTQNLTGSLAKFGEGNIKIQGFFADNKINLKAKSNLLNSAFEFENFDSIVMKRGHLHFGRKSAKLPLQSVMMVDGNINNVMLDAIDFSVNNAALFPKLTINLKSNDINLNNIHYDYLNIKKDDVRTIIDFANAFSNGQLVFSDWQKLIKIKLKSFRWNADSNLNFSFGTLPAFQIDIQNFLIGSHQLKNLTLKGSLIDEKLTLDECQINDPNLLLTARLNNSFNTTLEGKLLSHNVVKFIQMLDLPFKNLNQGEVLIDFKLKWPGNYKNLNLTNVSGKLEAHVMNGHFIGLSRTANLGLGFGQLINLLSWENIFHHINLDFSDLFEKGYHFDSGKLNATIKNGKLITRVARIQGNVADLDIKGDIDYISKQYNLKINVIPHLTSSLPTFAALLNPLMGVAVFVMDQIIKNETLPMTHYAYILKGSWYKPVWQKE